MGILISRFRRKETTIEILESIEKDISRLQKNRKDNQDKQKRIATSLLIYSFILYVISAVVFFLLYFPDTWPLRFLYSLPLLAFPFLIWGVKKLLHWYFVKRIHANDLALRDLREKRKQMLEDVMETETYKKAKEILEKFDPARFKKLESNEAASNNGQTSPTSTTPSPGLHQRRPTSQASSISRPTPAPTPLQRLAGVPTPNPFYKTPLRAPAPATRAPSPMISASGPRLQSVPQQQQRIQPQQQQRIQQQQMPRSMANTPAQMAGGPMMGRGYAVPPGPPMARSVLPRDRGTMDRVMDYLVGDGPENRYALICVNCSSHNGMALKEEFEYLSFRCCYCYGFNPARKQRPMAPRLEFFTPRPNDTKPSSGQNESDDEDDESDEEGEETQESSDNAKGEAKKGTASGTAPTTTFSSSQSKPPTRAPGTSAQQSSTAPPLKPSVNGDHQKPSLARQTNQRDADLKAEFSSKISSPAAAATITAAAVKSKDNATIGRNSADSTLSSAAEARIDSRSEKTLPEDLPFADGDSHSVDDIGRLGKSESSTATPPESESIVKNSTPLSAGDSGCEKVSSGLPDESIDAVTGGNEKRT